LDDPCNARWCILKCPLVHLEERAAHQPREIALDQHALADDEAHQVADRAELAQRHQRAEVAVHERPQRLALEPALDLTQHMTGLLVRRLGTRRQWARVSFQLQEGAVRLLSKDIG
jgi:hypothetical protein